MVSFEIFLNNTNLTFVAFLYKIYIEGFQKISGKESYPYWELNLQH